MRGYEPLRRRGDFGRVRSRGRRTGSAHLQFFAAPARPGIRTSRIGFVISSAVGNAVVRNRVRRRLRAILDAAAIAERAYRDVVVVARPGSGACPYATLADEVETALIGGWT